MILAAAVVAPMVCVRSRVPAPVRETIFRIAQYGVAFIRALVSNWNSPTHIHTIRYTLWLPVNLDKKQYPIATVIYLPRYRRPGNEARVATCDTVI